MITPSFPLTAVERVLPKLALDFTTATLDPRVTFTRTTDATHPATYINSSGVITSATNNQPRFDYNPTTLVCKGLLIEESRTNSYANSMFVGAVAGTPGTAPTGWTWQNSGGSLSITTGSIGENILAFSATAARQYLVIGAPLLANTTYSFTVYVSQNIGNVAFNQMFAYQSLPAGATVAYVVNGTTTTSSYVPVAGDRLELQVAVSTTAGAAFGVRLGIGTSGNSTGTVGLSKPQWETGAFATSYIPTTSAALTRNADVATMTGTNFSSWFNASEGTFDVVLTSNQLDTRFPRIFQADDGTTSNQISGYMYTVSSVNHGCGFTVASGGSTLFDRSIGSPAVAGTAAMKFSTAYKSTINGCCLNAGSVFQNTPVGTASGVNTLRIGQGIGVSTYISATFQKLFYYPQRLINGELQSTTK